MGEFAAWHAGRQHRLFLFMRTVLTNDTRPTNLIYHGVVGVDVVALRGPLRVPAGGLWALGYYLARLFHKDSLSYSIAEDDHPAEHLATPAKAEPWVHARRQEELRKP